MGTDIKWEEPFKVRHKTSGDTMYAEAETEGGYISVKHPLNPIACFRPPRWELYKPYWERVIVGTADEEQA